MNSGSTNYFVLLVAHLGVVLAVRCYQCKITKGTTNDENYCRIPVDGLTPTIECTDLCLTEIFYTTTYATPTDLSINRGCTDPCTTTIQSTETYTVEKQCCGADKCNTQVKPFSWLTCHHCSGDGILSCRNEDFIPQNNYVYCKGQCSKLYTDVFGDITVERNCSTSCTEGIIEVGIHGQTETWCCNKDLCNTGSRPVAMSAITLTIVILLTVVLSSGF